MFKNYLKIAIRNIIRHKAYSFINIVGLAVGMACCILILLWVQDELNYDRFHENSDQLFRILVNTNTNNVEYNVAVTPAALGPAIKEELPEIIQSARFKNWGNWQMRYGEGEYIDANSGIADASILEMFTFPLIKGNSSTALSNPHDLVLTIDTAEKLFGKEDPIGKTVEVKSIGDFTVTGVIDNVSHSHFDFDFFVPFQILEEFGQNITDFGGGSYNFTTYIMLEENADWVAVDEKIENYMATKSEDNTMLLFLQPLKDIYLSSDFAYDFTIRGDKTTVYIFMAIAALVLLIACINFINLTTARASNRAKEIGVRKVTGANRINIIKQFYGESILLAFFALIISVGIVELFTPVFNSLSGKELSVNFFSNPILLLQLIVIALVTGIISGSYPALFLSSFKPSSILKGSLTVGAKNSIFRRILVVFQFSLSIILLIGTFTIYRQLNYIRNKNLGYNKHHLAYLTIGGDIKSKYDVIKEELLKETSVENITASQVLPIYACPSREVSQWEDKISDGTLRIHIIIVDYNFVKTFEIDMAEGRCFSEDLASDSTGIIINQEAAKQLGFEEAIGKYLMFGEDKLTVIGVVKDFNFNTLHNKIAPLAIGVSKDQIRYLHARINSNDIPKTMASLNEKVQNLTSDSSLEFRFLDEVLDRRYRREQRAGQLITYFTVLAVFISCLGLFGLTSFMAEQKTKEIGIRKVFGAPIKTIVFLLTKEFTKWVILANVFAWPLAYYLLNKWLQGFAYKTDISPIIFLLSGLAAFIIAFVTVSFQIIKTAKANPIKALKYE